MVLDQNYVVNVAELPTTNRIIHSCDQDIVWAEV
jgi:hypothetical protein